MIAKRRKTFMNQIHVAPMLGILQRCMMLCLSHVDIRIDLYCHLCN
ncbi:hypothetical protein CRENPOLYSF2_1240016 [Crenothrix polyspora]|uniref:Uncharacterized protein n=1 Tax=Crenothrix polyspora TaxID=360316 RepID=A0A1R4H054_9GAMM|nr:hypothetical protein CRENPOLYSF2_1240016 [Crenothrix polyspora]